MLLVTHDIDEAIYMSDRILVMTQAPGRIDREIDIDLARPRDRTSDSFLRFRSEILEHLHFAGKAADVHPKKGSWNEAMLSNSLNATWPPV